MVTTLVKWFNLKLKGISAGDGRPGDRIPVKSIAADGGQMGILPVPRRQCTNETKDSNKSKRVFSGKFG